MVETITAVERDALFRQCLGKVFGRFRLTCTHKRVVALSQME
jgi:hypothetical protein